MKKTILCCLLAGFAFIMINAQGEINEKNRGKLGITFSSLGEDTFFYFGSVDGGADHENINFFTIGLNYVRGINKWLDFETGLEYSKHKFSIIPAPGIEHEVRRSSLNLMNIPLTVRANFFKYFFANGGLLVDIDVTGNDDVDKQTGIGLMLGIGAKYDFAFGLSVFANPYVKVHSVVPFTFDGMHERLGNVGVRMGIMYSL